MVSIVAPMGRAARQALAAKILQGSIAYPLKSY